MTLKKNPTRAQLTADRNEVGSFGFFPRFSGAKQKWSRSRVTLRACAARQMMLSLSRWCCWRAPPQQPSSCSRNTNSPGPDERARRGVLSLVALRSQWGYTRVRPGPDAPSLAPLWPRRSGGGAGVGGTDDSWWNSYWDIKQISHGAYLVSPPVGRLGSLWTRATLRAKWARSWAACGALWRRRIVTSPRPLPFYHKKRVLPSCSRCVRTRLSSASSVLVPPCPGWTLGAVRPRVPTAARPRVLEQLFSPWIICWPRPTPKGASRETQFPPPPRFLMLCKTADVIEIIWKRLSRPPTDARRSARRGTGREHLRVDSVVHTPDFSLLSSPTPQCCWPFLVTMAANSHFTN